MTSPAVEPPPMVTDPVPTDTWLNFLISSSRDFSFMGINGEWPPPTGITRKFSVVASCMAAIISSSLEGTITIAGWDTPNWDHRPGTSCAGTEEAAVFRPLGLWEPPTKDVMFMEA